MNTNQTVADVNSDMDDAWMEPFQDLKQYKVKEGRCNDPQDYLGTHQLGTRDNTQISQNRFLQPHTESSMTLEKVHWNPLDLFGN